MVFREWLTQMKYKQIPEIVKNYQSHDCTDAEIEAEVNRIKQQYLDWCKKKGVNPVF